MEKFECKCCGKCCMDFGKLGTLPLFDFEKKRFEKIGRKLKIDLKFIPENILFDKMSKKTFCLNWGLIGNPCPFLDKNKKCLIYEKRALICKAFPIEKIPEKKENLSLSCFMYCPKNNPQKILDSKENFENLFNKDVLNSRKKIQKKQNEISKKLKFLIDNKKIDLIKINEPKNCVISFENFKKGYSL